VLFSLPSVTLIHSYPQPACFFDAHSALGFVSLRDTLRLNCPSLIKVHLGREQVRLPLCKRGSAVTYNGYELAQLAVGAICFAMAALLAEPPRNGVCQSCNRAR
jgi:hypothetical protein